jgi:oligoribonuclease
VIVEIATVVTDDDLTIIAEGPNLVVGARDEQLSQMGDVVVDMHTRSGLLERIKQSTLTCREAEVATLDFLKPLAQAGKVPLTGNSIGTDRRFLQEYMPELEQFFHYRNVDVSTIKELAQRWHPEIIKQRPGQGHRTPRP